MYVFYSFEAAIETVEQLSAELAGVDDWPSLGLLLGVSKPKIEEIRGKYEYRGGAVACMRQLVEIWHTSNPSGSWKHIIRALERLGDRELATRLKAKYIWNQQGQQMHYS